MADRIIVDFQALDRISSRLSAAGRELDQAMLQLAGLHVTRDAGGDVCISGCGINLRTVGRPVLAGTVSEAVASYKRAVRDLSGYTGRFGSAVQRVHDLFETTENELSGKKLDVGEAPPAENGTESGRLSLEDFKKFLQLLLLYHPGISLLAGVSNDAVFNAFSSLWGYEFADGHPGVTAWIGKAGISASSALGSAEVNAYLGKVEVEAKADGGFMKSKTKREYQDGKWTEKETLDFLYGELGVSGSFAFIAADAKGTVGNDMLGAGVKAEGTIGSAKAEGKIKVSVGEEGVTALAKGEAMVAAVEGKASGTINILGIEITGEIGGYAGAAGVEGKIGIENNKFVMKGGAAALLGVSGGVEI
ncbi:MAG: hypothetical protein K2O18_10210, partial [Oscillospiraceae bacterium]|nr:hypothetical protein [Oscillospiraceae bacterium]